MAAMSGPDFITLLVSDLEASFEFYMKQCGLIESKEKRPNAHAFSAKPCGFAIRQAEDHRHDENPGSGIIIWWHTPDATALHGDLKGRGVQIVDELRKGPFGMSFSFKDPDGYTMTVHDGG